MQVEIYAQFLQSVEKTAMKRSALTHYLWLGIGVLSIGFGILALYHLWMSPWRKHAQPFLSISSPDRTYTINFSGQKDRPKVPFWDHSVEMEIREHGEILLEKTQFLSGDGLDPSFDTLFPNHQWIGNNTLLLYRDQYRRDTPLDKVEVINSSDITIRYIGIRSVDCAILLDISPRSTSTFQISGSRYDSKSVFVEGQLTKEKALRSQGASFDVQNKEPLVLKIDVSETGIAISRKQVNQ
jgi:hypothetical protein